MKNSLLLAYLFCGIGFIYFVNDRSAFPTLAVGFIAMFAVYGWLFLSSFEFKSIYILIVGIAIRLFFWDKPPVLSDDVYRFIWDGGLLAEGINPFAHLPKELLSPGNQSLFALLNSPEYYSVYPPIMQGIFWLVNRLGAGDMVMQLWIYRVLLTLAAILNYFLLKDLTKDQQKLSKVAMLYFLNPLVLMETVGNFHFEGLMVTFMLLAYYFYIKHRNSISAMMLAFAICVKLIPLIFLPYILVKYRWQGFKYLLLVGSVVLLLFMPFVSYAFLKHLFSSVDLYFHSFEFNASIYYVLRDVGQIVLGYNPIKTLGSILPVFIFGGAIFLSFKVNGIIKYAFLVLFFYLLLSTTVHPWYIIPLIVLGMMNGIYTPLIWSFSIILSYYAYASTPVKESPLLLILEYGILVVGLVFERSKWKKLLAIEE